MDNIPFISYEEKSGQWTLENDFTIIVSTYRLTVPGGFQTDLSSIPRPLWNIVAPMELSIQAPLVHDWLYRHGGVPYTTNDPCVRPPKGWYCTRGRLHEGPCAAYATFTRAQTDGFFRDIMAIEGVSTLKRHAAYYGVRMFGGSSWHQQ